MQHTKRQTHPTKLYIKWITLSAAVCCTATLFLSAPAGNPPLITPPCTSPCSCCFFSFPHLHRLFNLLSVISPHPALFTVWLPLRHFLTRASRFLAFLCQMFFIRPSRVCMSRDRSEYILVKRQNKHQTACEWSWQGKRCHSYFTVFGLCTPRNLTCTEFSLTDIYCVRDLFLFPTRRLPSAYLVCLYEWMQSSLTH